MSQPRTAGDAPGGSRRLSRALFGAATILVMGVAGLTLMESSPHFQIIGRLISDVETKDSVLALTFDDGPNPPFTGRILDELRAANVHATFFILGSNAEGAPAALQRMVLEGHEIGNHGYWHSAMTFKLPRVIEADIRRTDHIIQQNGGPVPEYVRAPYGKKLLVAPWVFWRLGKTHVMWSVEPVPSEFEAADAATIAGSVLSQAHAGSIVLLHDGGGDRSATVTALGLILRGLSRQGLSPVTVSELLKRSSSGN